ncbi:MAG: hypothetical protein IH840_11305 [Candidatus Heimdallarchaeota archaeon]|nr:hypothetical protein [Candidatus Heimdallarchaeota archaeon]
MKLEETTPAEFLFGRLAENITVNPPNGDIKAYNKIYVSDRRINVEIFLINFVYGFLVLGFATLFINSQPFLLLILFVLASGLLTGLKDAAHLRKYGYYLRASESLSPVWFSTFQSYISSLISGALFLGSYYVISGYDGLSSFFSLVVLLMVALFFYTKVMPDTSLVTLGLGSSILNPPGGIQRLPSHYRSLSLIQGNKSFQLALLRILLWFSIWLSLSYQFSLFTTLLLILVITTVSVKQEKINASSVLIKCRAIIQKSQPSILPIGLIDPDNSFSFTSQLDHGHRSRKPSTLSATKSNYFNSHLKNLKPYAVKAINKIADAIKNEEISRERNIQCYQCNEFVEATSDYCYYCGFSLK